MRWRDEVAERLRDQLEASPRARIAVFARRQRDVGPLLALLPQAVYVRISDARTSRQPVVMEAVRRLANADPSAVSECSEGEGAGRLVDGTGLDVAVVWLVMTRMPGACRQRLLADLHGALRSGGTLLVVDHNRPRSWGRWLGNVAWCVVRGVEPINRPAYPVAREVQGADFTGVSLRFAFGERVQIVRAARPLETRC